MAEFTVVVPLYNKGPHIARALNSVAAQVKKPQQIIVVDDGSTDGGFEYVSGLNWPNLIVERRTTPGPGGYAARNRGIALAEAEWVAFLDADDEWQPDHLHALSSALTITQGPVEPVLIFSGYENIWAGGHRSTDPYSARIGGSARRISFLQLLEQWVALNDCPIWTSATACRTEALREAAGFPEARCRRGGDKDTWLRVAGLGDIVYTGLLTARYFRDSVNMTTRRGYANSVPCIVQSAEMLRQTMPSDNAGLMTRLINQEIFNYALVSARTQGLEPQSWSAFDTRSDPARAMALRLLSSPAGGAVARMAYAIRKAVRR